MKKIFTLALGLIAALGVSAQNITVTTGHDSTPVEDGGTITAYLETGYAPVDLSKFGMGIVNCKYWVINPETRITCDQDCQLTISVNITKTVGNYYPQYCWPSNCISFSSDVTSATTTGDVKAGEAFDPLIDYTKKVADFTTPENLDIPTKETLYNELDVVISNGSTRLFGYKLIFTGDVNPGSVQGIAADDTDAPREYFDLQGRPVANPANGLYIVRQGSKVTKQYIR